MALWPAKKDAAEDPVEIDVPEDVGSEDSGPLEALTAQLGKLGELLDQTNEQVVAYLVHRESQAAASDDGAVGRLSERMDSLAEKLDRLDAQLKTAAVGATPPDATLTAAVGHLGDGLNAHDQAVTAALAQLQQRLDFGFQSLLEQLQPPEPDRAATGPTSGAEWQRIVLGPQLAEHPGLDFQRQQLLNGMVEGDPVTCSLIGQLLVFRSTTAEKMPPLLKEIGEAYYRWQPKTAGGSNPMETALVDWLKETMQEVGISNTIELVHPGERFESTRHHAASRGVEITEVCGWIVLRDNGKVYTKANVAVR